MQLVTESYLTQQSKLPISGRHIVAQYDDQFVVVYQAYRPEIGDFAAQNGYFGGEFRLNRMSWIKPNFTWMMYRSRWGTKIGQEVILAIWLKRFAFDEMLSTAVHSSFVPEVYSSKIEWKEKINSSSVRLQWDPDHHPSGAKLERRAIQIGIRGKILESYAKEWIVGIEDISKFVRLQYQNLQKTHDLSSLIVPRERIYPVNSIGLAQKLRLSENSEIKDFTE
ncbi:MAG: DUF4291 domain-containing protein [Cyanobacteria bacterium P01_A01_bin.45]